MQEELKPIKELFTYQDTTSTFEEKLDAFNFMKKIAYEDCDGDIPDGFTMEFEGLVFTYNKGEGKWKN